MHQVDLLNVESIQALMQAIEASNINVDVLINNAGLKHDASIEDMDYSDFEKVMKANLDGPWLLSKALISHLKHRAHPRIINISSGVAKEGRANGSNYAASKAALENLTISLAKELGQYHITVNAVAPGLIDTPMTEDVDAAQKQAYIQRVPLNRLVKPIDIAHACLFFASVDSHNISSQILGVNGGIR